jgi:hypothetical protein
VKMDMGLGYPNYIQCADAANPFDGLAFDNFRLNGTTLTETNWVKVGRFVTKNLAGPVFK